MSARLSDDRGHQALVAGRRINLRQIIDLDHYAMHTIPILVSFREEEREKISGEVQYSVHESMCPRTDGDIHTSPGVVHTHEAARHDVTSDRRDRHHWHCNPRGPSPGTPHHANKYA